VVQRITYARSESDATVRAMGKEPNKSDRATKRTVARGARTVRLRPSACIEAVLAAGMGLQDGIWHV